MSAKHLRTVMTLFYLASSVLPLQAQQSPNQPPPNIPSQSSPGPNDSPGVPRRVPVVPPQGGAVTPDGGSPIPQVPPGSPVPSGGTTPAAPTAQQTPIPIPPERRLLPPPT